MTNKVSNSYPVNSLGELVFQQGVGDTNIVGYLDQNFVPVDPITNHVPVVGLGPGGSGGSGAPVALTGTRNALTSDNGALLAYSGTVAAIVTINTGMPAGFGFSVAQLSSGQVQIVAGAGATVSNLSGFTRTFGQNAIVSVIQVGTNSYILVGAGAA